MTLAVGPQSGFDHVLWQEVHWQGLQRVSSIVDGNARYDELLEYRLTNEERAAYSHNVPISARREQACAHIRLHMLEKQHKILLPQFSGFVCEGSTHNNEREYAFFERECAPLGITVQKQNYSKIGTIGMGRQSPAEQALRDAVLESAQQYYRARQEISASLVRQLTLFSVSFFRFVVSFHRRGAVPPGVLVQANDHSPLRVAMAMVMKGLGVPRIYLQHAEVTSSFPPLDFEYSILRNAESKAVYEQLGPLTGQVFVLPRYEEHFAADRLAARHVGPQTAVIYPTSRVVLDNLKAIIAALNANPEVDQVTVKQHPAAARQLQELLAGAGISFTDAVPEAHHIAIVGNSSVVIELLHRGIPVYQNFEFDPVAADYYGFVTKGLTRQVSIAMLSQHFWSPYKVDEAWRNKFKAFDPTVDTDYRVEQDRFLVEMQRLGAAILPQRGRRRMRGSTKAQIKAGAKRGLIALVNAAPSLSAPVLEVALATSSRVGNFLTVNSYLGANYLRNRTNISLKGGHWSGARGSGSRFETGGVTPLIEKTLCDLHNPAEWIRENQRLSVFADEAVIGALENMFQDRRPQLGNIFSGFPTWDEGSTVATWIHLKRAEWGNITLASDELDHLQAFVVGLGPGDFAKPLLERALLAAIIRCGTAAQLDAFWVAPMSTTIDSIGTNTRIGILQKLYSEPDRMAQAVAMRQRFEATSSALERLKLRNMDYLSARAAPGWSHQSAEDLFAQLTPKGVSRQFSDLARPFYARFRDRMALMEIRTNPAQAQMAMTIISQALSERRPLSLMRLSDGEGYLFPGHPHFTAEDARNRERHWWDTELPAQLSARIIEQARQAVAAADLVGIPSVYRFIRDTGDTSYALSQSLQGRGLLQVLAGLPELLADYAQLSEDKINVSLFSNLDAISKLSALATRTVVVGSVRREYLPEPVQKLANLSIIAIPTHARTARNERYLPNSTALPFIYEQVLNELAVVRPGDLVLVAGGIVGKIMLGHARASGAVALDIGSVLDDWISSDQKSVR